jgi:Carboxypeptidase regulatory-like domain/TonB-dependent Receptor Plug Domain
MVLAVAGLLCAAGALAAQSGLGSITGSIKDQTNAVLPGATIRVVETSTGTTRSVESNEAGLFTIPNVTPGTYTITISLQSFKTVELPNITVNSFQQLSLGAVTLDVSAGPTDVIEVTASRPILDLDSGTRIETIQSQQVRDMPLQGRNWSTLLKIIPGSNPTNGSAINGREYSASGYADFNINGKNPGQTQVNLDGGSLVDHGSDGKTTVAPSLESIQEVSVLTNNFQAEYGNRGGTVVNIVTKSGTNQLKGAVFDYLRNESLNANTWPNTFLGIKKPPYRFNYFGGNLGGPIQRNKLFFFYNYENFKQQLPGGIIQGRVPTERERNGDFSQTVNADGSRPAIFMPGTQFSGTPVQITNGIIPQELINPLGRALMNAYPLPNNPSDPNNNYVQSYNREMPRFSHTARVDWNISDKTQMYGRYTADGGAQVDRNVGSSAGNLGPSLVRRPRPDYALATNLTHTFTPTLVMNTLFAWSYDYVEWGMVDPDTVSKSKLGLSNLPTVYPLSDDVLPQLDTTTYGAYNFNRIPAYARANEYQVASTFTWARGTHVIKYGGQYIRNLKNEIDSSNYKGYYDFRPVAGSPSAFDTGYAPSNILVGALSRFQQLEQVSHKNSVYNDIHAFVQDTWKLKNLTLDYGVRFYHIPTEHNRNPDDTLDAVFLPSKWDPAKAPRFYIPDPKNPSRVIDPAFPDAPVAANLSNVLRYTIVPNSGDLMNGVIKMGDDGVGTGIANPRWALFAPRGGFAWTPFGQQHTLIRGGFGWAYNRNNIANTINDFENTFGGFANLAQTSLGTLASPTVQPITARNYAARDETSRDVPTVYDYSLSLQQQLFGDLVLDVAYVGNIQKHQPVRFNLNAIAPGTMFKPEFVAANSAGYNFAGAVTASNPGPLPGSNTMDPIVMRPYRGFDTIRMTSNIADVTYNALQVSASKRLSHRFSFDVGYTLSKVTNNTENVGDPAGVPLAAYEAYTGYISNDNRTHVVTLNYIYELPKVSSFLRMDNAVGHVLFDDWKLAHLFSVFSGQDYSPTFSIQQANTTTNVDIRRVLLGTPDFDPRLLLNGDVNGLKRDEAHQFDPTALSIPTPGGDGTGPRNFIHGRGSFSNDLSIVKQIPLAGRSRLEVRANIYNVFNNVRRISQGGTDNVGVANGVQYKANGRTFQDGFTLYNTPEALVSRAQASGINDPAQLFNLYRTGVGHVNLTGNNSNPVQPPRIIEIGMALRF